MAIAIQRVEMNLATLRTRMPFRYGIASLTKCPHLFERVTATVDGKSVRGISADHLPPKWFTKDPRTSFAEDLEPMIAQIRTAADFAVKAGEAPSAFALWQRIGEMQRAHWTAQGMPPLLWNFGTSLVERALIEAVCRSKGLSFFQALQQEALGVRLGEMHPELEGRIAAELLGLKGARKAPPQTIIARHTVGLGDPLADADIPADERVRDGLPQSLQACIAAYGLTHFKIKLAGDAQHDAERLRRIAALLEGACGGNYAHTLDGNENFAAVEAFRAFWESIENDRRLEGFLRKLVFVEQPMRRDAALSAEAVRRLREWAGRPRMIIDESDSAVESMREALAAGYAGVSHKNCKGVFKSIANAALIAFRGGAAAGLIQSGEDISNIGPVALGQDTAVAAAIGITHAERNGHHYFAGLSQFPMTLQEKMVAAHGDVFGWVDGPAGRFAAAKVSGGRMEIGSFMRAPMGVGFEVDVEQFTPLAQWRTDAMEGM